MALEPVQSLSRAALLARVSVIEPRDIEIRPRADRLSGVRPKVHVAVDGAPAAAPHRPNAGGQTESEVVRELREDLNLSEDETAALRALLAAGMAPEDIVALVEGLRRSTGGNEEVAIALLGAFAQRGGLANAPGLRARIDGRSAALLAEVAGQAAVEFLKHADHLPPGFAIELAAVSAWTMSFLSADEAVSTPTAMLEMLLSGEAEARTRTLGLSLAAPRWCVEHMAREDQAESVAEARTLTSEIFGPMAAPEQGYAEAAAIACCHRFGDEAARSLLNAYYATVGDAAGLVLSLAMAEHGPDPDPEEALEALADLVETIETHMVQIEVGGGTPEVSLPQRQLIAGHVAEQLISGRAHLFLIVMRLFGRNARFSKLERLRRIGRMSRDMAAHADEHELERWVNGFRS
ncbi:MAG: hypothetical protein AAF654_11035 [Myxococcota bacterium]